MRSCLVHASAGLDLSKLFKRLALVLSTVSILGGAATPALAGQPAETRAESVNPVSTSLLQQQTRELIELMVAYRQADTTEQANLLNSLQQLLEARQAQLSALSKSNPTAALQNALSLQAVQGMPAEIQSLLEQKQQLEGVLEILYEDGADGDHRLLHVLKTHAGELVALHFGGKAPGLASGATVRANGLRIGDSLVLGDEEGALETLALGGTSTTTSSSSSPAALPNTLGEQRTLVMLVNFQDDPNNHPWTANEVSSLVFGSVSDFFKENSYGQTWLNGDVAGWFTLPLNSTGCDQAGIAQYAKAAASAAGVNLSSYNRYVYLFPHNANCFWAGTSTVGGAPSQAWINGYLDMETIAHELGHSLGLYHSRFLQCEYATFGSNCVMQEYGDNLDIMGGADSAHFNAFQKERLGWLNSGVMPPITTVSADGTYEVAPFEPAGQTAKALKIPKGIDPVTGKPVWYYVEYRQPIGLDTWIGSTYRIDGYNVFNGVVIHTGSPEQSGNTSTLLDMTPDTYVYPWDPALEAGNTFTDPDTGTTITVDRVDANGASVSVVLGTQNGSSDGTQMPSGNTAPVAVDDAAALATIAPIEIDVLNNDWDADNDVLAISAVTQGGKGSVTITANGTLMYTPARNFKGSDSFGYTLSDGKATSTATVSISLQSSSSGGKGGGNKR